jgi:radical SAM protein with 4Fe4S-binding SPASM domain
MQPPLLHRFQIGERRFVIDPSTCFCFECDHISWDVLEYYPREPVNRIYHLLEQKHPRKELEEVVGELEWLRVTKAILITPKEEDLLKEAAETPDLQRIAVVTAVGSVPLSSRIASAGTMLLAGSGKNTELQLILVCTADSTECTEEVMTSLKALKQAARFVGKNLSLVVRVALHEAQKTNDAVQYSVETTLREDADNAAAVREVLALAHLKFGKVADALQRLSCAARSVLVACPRNERFEGLLKTMYEAGFREVHLDIPALYAQVADLTPEAVSESLRENVAWYGQHLLQGHPFRVEPFVTLFGAVHQGRPIRRMDDAGCRELAVDADGTVYPSLDFLEQQACAFGTLQGGERDKTVTQVFDGLGANRIPACLSCWAQCLCGGGHAIVHWRRTGNPRMPDPAWCDAQRQWLAHLIDAFNTLVSSGVNFSHVTSAMTPTTSKMSWWKAAKTAYEMRLIPRPLQDQDAAWLVQWENWNTAAYFVCNESGLLLASQYDREMDALHPRGIEQELVLTRTNGTPCGLLRMRPDTKLKGLAWAWLYMHDTKAYSESGVRRALKALLAETTKSQQIRRILTPVTPAETELASYLESLGFHSLGVQRQALYLHNEYLDVAVYSHEVSR